MVNSRDVAEKFGKRHDHVMRDVDSLLHAPNLGDGWFREVSNEHPTISGRVDRSFDMTRDGFTLLAMGGPAKRKKWPSAVMITKGTNGWRQRTVTLEGERPIFANNVIYLTPVR